MSTRKRNVSIQFYLNTREADLLDRKVKATGLSRTVFLRHLVNGFQPRELPPPDYRDLMNALYGIGRNLNQLTTLCNMGKVNSVNLQPLVDEYAKLNQTLTELLDRKRWSA